MTLEINWREVEGILAWDLSFIWKLSFNLLRVEIWECYLGPEQTTLALLWINHWACSVAKLCLTLCEPMDCSPPGSSVHGIFQTRILEWVAITFSRGSSQPRDLTHIS